MALPVGSNFAVGAAGTGGIAFGMIGSDGGLYSGSLSLPSFNASSTAALMAAIWNVYESPFFKPSKRNVLEDVDRVEAPVTEPPVTFTEYDVIGAPFAAGTPHVSVIAPLSRTTAGAGGRSGRPMTVTVTVLLTCRSSWLVPSSTVYVNVVAPWKPAAGVKVTSVSVWATVPPTGVDTSTILSAWLFAPRWSLASTGMTFWTSWNVSAVSGTSTARAPWNLLNVTSTLPAPCGPGCPSDTVKVNSTTVLSGAFAFASSVNVVPSNDADNTSVWPLRSLNEMCCRSPSSGSVTAGSKSNFFCSLAVILSGCVTNVGGVLPLRRTSTPTIPTERRVSGASPGPSPST